jgi:two-component system KDP operon response regulator KdpE
VNRTILVVEDEPDIRQFLRSSLGAEGYRVVESPNGRRGTLDAGMHKPDLAIVDLGLPDFDGVEVIRRIREWSPMPILVLSARIQEPPRSRRSTRAPTTTSPSRSASASCWRACARRLRHARGLLPEPNWCWGTSDQLRKTRRQQGGAEVHLTPIEFRLLSLPREAHRHGGHPPAAADRSVGPDARGRHALPAVYMKQLREKLESDPVQPKYLLTETGVGYRLVD